MMTYLRLANTDRIKTAVVGNGPSNMLEVANARPVLETKVLGECIPNYYENKEVELKKRSSVYWPEKLCKTSSLLILSGLNDNRQNPEQARVFTKKLDSLNYKYVLKEVETDHFFSDQKPFLQTTLVNWFNEHLKPCK
jgi:dipeptidyl aminopeptidase/acylaminoacyl peptidase